MKQPGVALQNAKISQKIRICKHCRNICPVVDGVDVFGTRYEGGIWLFGRDCVYLQAIQSIDVIKPKIFVSLLCAAVVPFAGAQTYVDTVPLPEVSVTALKQGLDLRMQPVSATVLGRGKLMQSSVAGVKGLSMLAPNFHMADYGSRMTSSIYVRGLGSRMDQPAVGLTIDNIPVLTKDNFDFDLIDLDRAEVARGPQATLFGRNTMGGVINLYTMSPMSWHGLRVLAEGGSRPMGRVGVSDYFGIGEKVGMGLAVNGQWKRGAHTNRYDGSACGTERNASARIKTVWMPGAAFRLSNSAIVSFSQQDGYPYAFAETGEINYNDRCAYIRRSFMDGLSAVWDVDGVKLSAVGSVQYLNDRMNMDQDFLPVDYFTLCQAREEWGGTLDLFASGSKGVYSWLGGAFAFVKSTRMGAPVTFLDDGIRNLIEGHRNEANPDYPISWDSREFLLDSDFKYPVYGLAAYHRSTLSLGRWTVEGGLRLDYEHAALRYRSYTETGYTVWDATGDEPVAYKNVPVLIDDRGRLKTSSLELLPRVSVSWRIPMRQEGVVFASVSEGYKSGGFNTQMFSDVLQQKLMGTMGIGNKYDIEEMLVYKPERALNYETGFHVSCAEGRLETDFTAFYIDCRDQQITMFPDGVTTGRVTANAGRTHSRGVELELRARPWQGLSVNGAFGYTDARFKRFDDGIHDYSGNRVPYAPVVTAYIRCAWLGTISRNSLRYELAADARLTGPIYWDEANTLRQPLYCLPGVSATLWWGEWSVRLWCENVTDTKYNVFSFTSIGNRFLQRGNPLQAGVTLRYTLTTK